MAINIRDIFLKMIPYVLSVAGGLILFVVTKDEVHNPNVTDLINNISASLLSIPLVFLLYDYSNFLVSRRLKKTLSDNLGDKISVLLLKLTMVIRQMTGQRGKLTFTSLNNMGDLSISYIASHLKITDNSVNALREIRDDLDTVIYKNTNTGVLSADEIQSLSSIIREISQLINEHSFRKNKRIAAKYIKNITGHITDWMDSDAFASMHFQQLLGDAMTENTVQNAK